MAERRIGAPRTARITTAVVLMAVGSGAVDAFSFAGLGAVFASVMTGNLVLLGIALVRTRLDMALAAGCAIVAYVVGVYGATGWLGSAIPPLRGERRPASPRRRPARRRRSPAGSGPAELPVRLRRTLAAVPVVQAVVLAGWLAGHGHPGLAAQLPLLALSAVAMGVQSASVNTLPLAGAATTYLTGTLTALTTELATSGSPETMRRRFAVLAAALAGAGLDAALFVWARPAAPALPLAATVAAAVLIRRR